MRTLCFGGSFNPVHNAHLRCATAAAVAGGFDRVLWIPTRAPVLKETSYEMAPAEDRLAMLQLAIRSSLVSTIDHQISNVELLRATPSYTVDTARYLLNSGQTEVNWLIGADQLLNLPHWHEFPALIRLVRFWVMRRPGYVIDWSRVHVDLNALQARVVEVPQIDISATDIRRRVRDGQPIDALVPPDVREYILAHRLYIPSAEPVHSSD